jgi:hypothetical protein
LNWTTMNKKERNEYYLTMRTILFSSKDEMK